MYIHVHVHVHFLVVRGVLPPPPLSGSTTKKHALFYVCLPLAPRILILALVVPVDIQTIGHTLSPKVVRHLDRS